MSLDSASVQSIKQRLAWWIMVGGSTIHTFSADRGTSLRVETLLCTCAPIEEAVVTNAEASGGTDTRE